jgi:hypothetical protein
MLFSNFLFAVALTVVWPLGMLGLLAACAWLERRTLVAEEIIPRRLRRMESKPPEAVEAMVLEETSELVADYWSTPTHPYFGAKPSPNGRRPEAAEPAPGSAPPAAEEPRPRRAIWPRNASEPPPPAPVEPAAAPEPAPPGSVEARTGPDPALPGPRVVPSRVERLARRRPPKGRHERR